MIVAAILDLDESPRTLPKSRQGPACKRFLLECLLGQIQHIGDELILVAVLDYALNIWQIGRLLRLKRGPTSCYHDIPDARTRNPANGTARIRRRLRQ